MDEKELKTSGKQRFFIILIAVIMLGSMIAGYAAIVIGGSKSDDDTSSDSQIDDAKVAEYQAAYEAKTAEFAEATKDDYKKFVGYKDEEVKAYNETSANENGLKTRDLVTGSGETVAEGNYLAYYIGWCADGSIFDSSFDDNEKPTGFRMAINPEVGMIEGWTQGVKDMKIGGIREVTIPGELAYGDSQEICGGKNKPLKFIVMAVANKDPLKKLSEELKEATLRVQYATYGIDYDQMSQAEE